MEVSKYIEQFNRRIKAIMLVQAKTYNDVAIELKAKYDYNISGQNLSKKVRSGSLRIPLLVMLLDILDYDFNIFERKK